MTSRYDLIKDCPACESLREELSQAKDTIANLTAGLQSRTQELEALAPGTPKKLDLSKLLPYQDSEKAKCPLCRTLILTQNESGNYHRRSDEDDLACQGRKWWQLWKSCPRTAHIHRHCYWCGARWFES